MPVSFKNIALLSVLWMVLATGQLEGQYMSYRHFTSENGLPSSEVYDVLQDAKGYLWFATDYGVARFDGYSFTLLGIADGLPDQTVFQLYEDHLGNIWFATFTGGVCYFDGSKVVVPAFNTKLRTALPQSWVTSLHLDKRNSLWFTAYHHPGKLFKAGPDSSFTEIDPAEWLDLSQSDFVFLGKNMDENGWVVNSQPTSEEAQDPAVVQLIDMLYLNVSVRHSIRLSDQTYLSATSDGSLIHFNEKEILFHRTDLKYLFVESLYQDRTGAIWICHRLGAYRFQNGDISQNPDRRLFEGRPIRDMALDQEGNYWIITGEGGVFQIPSVDIYSHKLESVSRNEKMIATIQDDANLYFASFKGAFFRASSSSKLSQIKDPDLENELWNVVLNPVNSQESSYHVSGGASVFAGSPSTHHILVESAVGKKRKSANAQVAATDLWVSIRSSDNSKTDFLGILHTDTKTRTEDRPPFKSSYTYPVSMQSDLGNEISCLATKGAGLLFQTHDSLYNINHSTGLNSDLIKCILLQSDTILWVGTNQGLNKLILDRNGTFSISSISSFSTADGLPSDEINGIAFWNDRLWLATNKGVASFLPDKLDGPEKEPPILINKVLINGKVIEPAEDIKLSSSQKNLTFEFLGISFRTAPFYRYRLNGFQEKWTETKERNISFVNLPAGDYQFEVNARYGDGNWHDKAQSFRFSIERHFTQSFWFILLISLILFGIIYGIIRIVIHNRERKSRIEKRIMRSEQKALRSQMNPHFIFNAMNSIQYFMTENDKRNASVYLSRFSSLMRKTLDNSKKNRISLEEEIAVIISYLELEKLRFGDKFSYKLSTEKGLDIFERSLPAMMIQPFLENAIWHGLMPKEAPGHLSVNFTAIDDELMCTIADNGIGRIKAAEIRSRRKRKHSSTGIQNIQERMDLINSISGSALRMEITDLSDSGGKAKGTEVKLFFPA